MKSVGVLLIAFCLCSSGPAHSESAIPQAPAASLSDAWATSQAGTPAEQRIQRAKQEVEANPRKAAAFNDLAIAYIRRARETADRAYLRDADSAIEKGLATAPADFQISKTAVALLLAQEQFTAARDKAIQLNRRTPDDAMIYGFIAEADIALGDYDAAEKAAQWMLNMQPNNLPGLQIGATLRVLYGDSDGALDLLNLAYKETSPIETEDQAWIANQIASIQIDSGKIDAAAAVLEGAESIFPHYPYTLENMARLRLAQQRVNDAIVFLKEASINDSNPHIVCELALAQQHAGDASDAQDGLKKCEELVAKNPNEDDVATREIILMRSGNPVTAASALALAQQQVAIRHDVWTLDAYAWALYGNGKFQEAESAINKAITVGIQSSQIYDHAGHIEQRLNHEAEAGRLFELSVRTNPLSEYAVDARRAAKILVIADAKSPATNKADAMPELDAFSTVPQPLALLEGFQSQTDLKPDRPARSIRSTAPIVFDPVPVQLLTPHASDTERVIHNTQASVARAPKDSTLYASLGAAYFQRARETGNVDDYQLAEESLAKSLDLVSADFSAGAALRAMAAVCMGEHRFNDALTYADKALALGSGDLSPFAIVGDAYADMGEYSKAGVAYSRLSSADAKIQGSSYIQDSRLSYLKFISGDTSGAIEKMKSAVQEGLLAQLPSENMAWLYYELGEFSIQAGEIASANSAYLAALKTHPGDYRALAALAKLRAAEGRISESIVLYQKAIAIVPMPIYIAELGDLYRKARNQAEAQKQYQLVEYIGQLGRINQALHNRDLALFYADHDVKLSEALDLAQKELEVRHDVYTWDALAWSLFKNGKYTDAQVASKKALQYGTQDSLLLFHAGMISQKLGELQQASQQLRTALAINPHFHVVYSDMARQQLELLSSHASNASSGGDHAR